jgi:D-3-phosphoglycerate dehydrogenase
VATPHLGAATSEAQENVALQIAEQMADFLTSGAVANAINMPALTAEEATRLKPYMKLAEQLGSFAGQMSERGIETVTLEYEGAIAELNVKPLTAIALTALLGRSIGSVNMVNVGVICRERNIRVSETTRAEPTDYQTLIRLVVTGDAHEHVIAGTLFGGDKPRLVEIEGIAMEAELGPSMLFIRNQDKPGFIGNLGRTLSENGVNIATFHLGRTAPGEDAIALIQVDETLTDPVIDQVCAIPNVITTKALRF